MFTMEQVDELHARLGRADSLADYLRALASIGVTRFESFLTDGHTEYVGASGERIRSGPHHEVMDVAHVGDREAMLEHLRMHAAGETSYVEMSRGLADSGVERWVADTSALTMTYRDRAGAVLLVEHVDAGT